MNFGFIVESVMQSKKASTLPHYLFYYPTKIEIKEFIEPQIINRFFVQFFEQALYLDESWIIDGSQTLCGILSKMRARTILRSEHEHDEKVAASVRIEHDLWYLDGTVLLDGSRLIDAYVEEVSL